MYRCLNFICIFLVRYVIVKLNAEEYSCENTICNPRAGDLLIGRESSLWASSTCGMNDLEVYCVVTTSGRSFCRECTSKQPYNLITNPESHRIENVVSRVPSNPKRWWQSECGVHNVSIVLNLDTQFQFISTILRFKTYRPAAMYLERSYDFGRSWKRYAYFSSNCRRDFPAVPEGPRRSLTDVTCTGVYSQLTPSEGGVVAYMAAPSEMHASWPQYSKERMNLTAITNLRAVFTRLNTLGDMHVDDSILTRRKYYYALYEWNVWGRCTCFGHAVRCKPKSSAEVIKPEKVYGVCECTHNTAGENCETCADFYWDKPWRPATKDEANACEKCNCNNHATACFFNPVLYIQSNNVSGGNCHGCMHNTEGVNCEFCQPNFYRHQAYPIDHPNTCQPCNCHTDGTLYRGYCQQYDDAKSNLLAGQCLCKKNVGGDKCDRCKVGFWNFQADNPKGCGSCSCNMMGTLDNGGCDPLTGVCTCKRFVGGQNCDQCLEGYFNLTMAPLGCQKCSCSQLGAKNPNCEPVNGQCDCKTGFTGRDCSRVKDGFFVKPPQEMIDNSGEKKVNLDGPKGQGKFVIVLDVDPKQFRGGDRWSMIIEPYQDGAKQCRNLPQKVDVYQDTSKIIVADVCLEPGLPIVLRIMPDAQPNRPYTEILISDVILVPTDDSNLARRCESYREMAMDILSGVQPDRSGLPPECEVYFRLPRVSWKETQSYAQECFCNTTGSESDVCDKRTGQCPCRPGVIGRRCDKCALYHYEFSALGCTDCACNSQGSLSLQCKDGKCDCRPGIEGKYCNNCLSGTWNFPTCIPCQCNGFSDVCNQTTGACLDCRNQTGGHYCEGCAEGFYGDPLQGAQCKPCSCPGGGVNHAISCQMGSLQEQICHCKTGYTGERCSQCAMNHFGNPTEFNGTCQPCQCSGNINMNEPGGCDQVTGECLKCLHNSEGISCEQCALGYWGDATKQMCQLCNCYPPGSIDEAKKGCNRQNGQCPCLPNVIGARCYECAPGYFNLTSGDGCEPCQCDPTGSFSDECDPVSGQCSCNSDRSGRKCDQCRQLFYGDPHKANGCQFCDCDMMGSTSGFCAPADGQCPCKTGIAGRRCDRCDRGTEGKLPNCKPCGECWTDWDETIDGVKAEFDRLQNQTGRQLPQELESIFDGLVRLLEQIENLPWMNFNDTRLQTLMELLNKTQSLITKLNAPFQDPNSVTELKDKIMATLTKEERRSEQLDDIRDQLMQLTDKLEKIIDGAGDIERLNPHAAIEALRKFQNDARHIKDTEQSVKLQIDAMWVNEGMARTVLDSVEPRAKKLDDSWNQLEKRIEEFKTQMKQINRKLCGDNTIPPDPNADVSVCPSSCGGAACDPVSKTTSTSSDRSAEPFIIKGMWRGSNPMVDDWTGLIGGCGNQNGCNASVSGRLADLMNQFLEVHMHLMDAIRNVNKAEGFTMNVHVDQKIAEASLDNATAEANRFEDHLISTANLTDSLVNKSREFITLYTSYNQSYFANLLQTVKDTKLNATLSEARQTQMELEQLAHRLQSHVAQILKDTEEDKRITADLFKRANKSKTNAQGFKLQVDQLNETNKIYDDLKTHPIIQLLPKPDYPKNITNFVNEVDSVEVEKSEFAKEATSVADDAKEALDRVEKIRDDTIYASKLTMDSAQDLQNIDLSYKQLDEKMVELERLMRRLTSGNNKTDNNNHHNNGADKLADPTKLMQEVQNYTDILEAQTNEIVDISTNLEKLDREIVDLVDNMTEYTKKMKVLGTLISEQTKFHQMCT